MHRWPAANVLGPPPSRGRYLELKGGINACHIEYVYESCHRDFGPGDFGPGGPNYLVNLVRPQIIWTGPTPDNLDRHFWLPSNPAIKECISNL